MNLYTDSSVTGGNKLFQDTIWAKVGRFLIYLAFIGIAIALWLSFLDGFKLVHMIDIMVPIIFFVGALALCIWFKGMDERHRISVGEHAYKLEVLEELESGGGDSIMKLATFGIGAFIGAMVNAFLLFSPTPYLIKSAQYLSLCSCFLGAAGIFASAYSYKSTIYSIVMKEQKEGRLVHRDSESLRAESYISDEQYDAPGAFGAPHSRCMSSNNPSGTVNTGYSRSAHTRYEVDSSFDNDDDEQY
ncbi:MAG: hypothetical protein ACI38Q_07090 [Candidatus Bruticola sp.]